MTGTPRPGGGRPVRLRERGDAVCSPRPAVWTAPAPQHGAAGAVGRGRSVAPAAAQPADRSGGRDHDARPGCAEVRAPAAVVLLCQDEGALHLRPVLRAVWMRRGPHLRVPSPGTNRTRAVFGAVAWETGRWLDAITARQRAVACLAFLEQVRAAAPDRPVRMVVDKASSHTAKAVRAWRAEHPRRARLFLVTSTSSGHAEHPVATGWWRLKGHVAANRLSGTIEALVATVPEGVASFTPQDARRLAA